ncbi:MAG TPA: choice-of-anchor Q domain-containing protein, partial [Flavobacterium sp.]
MVDNVTINGNTAAGAAADDGGAGIFNTGGTLNIMNSTISNNLATGASGSGGGIFSLAGTVSIENSTLEMNSANRAGGAIEAVNGTLNINNSILADNDVDGTAGVPNPGNGGGIHISAITNTTITGGYIEDNDARREGGGLWNQTGSTMTLDMVTVDSNSASGPEVTHGGGGIFNNGGTLMINNSTIANNNSDGALGNGGGIHIKSGDATIMTSTISTNWSTNGGGGIYNNAALTVNASTITNNSGAIYGGGIANNGATATIKNTIVAGNTSPSGVDITNGAGAFTSNGYNLIGQDDTNAFTALATDMEGTSASPIDPMLGPLADNGGSTFTHMLLAGSPAYNAGDPSDQFNDQIDQMVFGGIRDIGAYEAQSQLAVGDFNSISRANTAIYPNPSVGGFVNVAIASNFGSDINGKIIEIGSGKTVLEFKPTTANSQISLDNIASGLYVVQLTSEISTENHKLIVR